MQIQISKDKIADVSGQTTEKPVSKSTTVLCMFDNILGNLIIHYSKIRVLHPQQGFEDILEVVREEKLLGEGIKLIYLLAGRADILHAPSGVTRNVEKLLHGLARIEPRIMVVIGAILIVPSDSKLIRESIHEINHSLARIAETDHHWVFFNPNISVSIAGEPQKRFFDREDKVNKAGCRFIAQGLVASSKAARMLQNFSYLPPKKV